MSIGDYQCDQIWRFFWILGNFLKPLATIILPKSPTFLGKFCKDVKIFHFSSEINFGQLLQTFGVFFWSHCREHSSMGQVSPPFLQVWTQILYRIRITKIFSFVVKLENSHTVILPPSVLCVLWLKYLYSTNIRFQYILAWVTRRCPG